MVSQEHQGNTLTPDSTLVESQPTEDIVASLQAQCTQHLDDETREKIMKMVRPLKQQSAHAAALTRDLEDQLLATNGSLDEANAEFRECQSKWHDEIIARQQAEQKLTVAHEELRAAGATIEALGGANAAEAGAEELE